MAQDTLSASRPASVSPSGPQSPAADLWAESPAWSGRWSSGDPWFGWLSSLCLHASLAAALAIPLVRGVRLATGSLQIAEPQAIAVSGSCELVETSIEAADQDFEPSSPLALKAARPDLGDFVDRVFVVASQLRTLPAGAFGDLGVRDGAAAANSAWKLPKGAVVAGSFAAWWVPKVERFGERVEPGQLPRVGQDYRIVVQFRVDPAQRSIRVDDLSGDITGSDGFKQRIPDRAWIEEADGRLTLASPDSVLRVRNGVAELSFKVTAAGQTGVRDTIRIRSASLREEQVLKLVFQPRPE